MLSAPETNYSLVPFGINSFNLIIMRNFFNQVPYELIESAKLDGASEFDLVRYEYMIRLRELQTSADQALTELFYTYKQYQGRVTVQMYYKAVKEIYEQYDRIYNHIVMDYEQKVLQIARKDTVQYRMQFAA